MPLFQERFIMTDTALLVIDAQESFRHRPYWTETDLPDYLARQQALIDGCVRRGVPVVRIFHTEVQGVFSIESGLVTTLKELSIAPDVTFHKSHHSALAGTPLAAWLIARGIRRLIVSGIRTEQCCETTTRHASDSGFDVDYVTEATLTFPMTHAGSGRTYTSHEIKERSELVLAGRFARIATVADALAAIDAARAPATEVA
jgi:nicotinamidase-related amidase